MSQTETGTLKHGFIYNGEAQLDFEMGPVERAGDLFDAEVESGGVENELTFNAALMAVQLKRIGECDGPFGLHNIRSLSPEDYKILRVAQIKLNAVDSDPKQTNSVKESGSTSC